MVNAHDCGDIICSSSPLPTDSEIDLDSDDGIELLARKLSHANGTAHHVPALPEQICDLDLNKTSGKYLSIVIRASGYNGAEEKCSAGLTIGS